MKAKIIAFIQRHPNVYRLAKSCFHRYCMLFEPKLKYSELSETEQAIYQKLKKAFK